MTPRKSGPSPEGPLLLYLAIAIVGSAIAAPSIPLLAVKDIQSAGVETQRPRDRRPTSATSADGKDFFYSREVAPVKLACADCHLIQHPQAAPPDDLIRSGHNLFDAFGRGNWWSGRITTDAGEAGEICIKQFQGAPELPPFARVGLVRFMKRQAAPFSNPWIVLRVPAAQTDVSGGKTEPGQDLFRRACAFCHPGGSAAAKEPSLQKSKMTPQEIGELVRTGRGTMPFFQADILSRQDVADIAAYTYSLQPKKE